MQIYCTERFKSEFDLLKKKNSYKGIEKDIIEYFFNKTATELESGTRLNGHAEIPYIKKRLEGKGGFRVYFLLIFLNEKLYLMYIHPKTGALGRDNITPVEKALYYKGILEDIKSDNLYELTTDQSGTKLSIEKVKKDIPESIHKSILKI